MNDPRHARRTGNSGPPAPPEVVPMLVWIGVSLLLLVIGYASLTAVGLTYEPTVLRRGQATIQSCSPNVFSLGTTQLCRATIEWEPRDQWSGDVARLDRGPSYTIESTEVLTGTVAVEGHPYVGTNNVRRETIVPAGQVPRTANPLWFLVGLGIPVVISVALMALVILPWIRRRKRAAGADDPPAA